MFSCLSTPGHYYLPSITHTRTGLAASDEGQRCHLSRQIRRIKVPANFDAVCSDFDQIDCISERPVIKAMTDSDLMKFVSTNVTKAVFFLTFQHLKQAMKRLVKLVTKDVCGQRSLDDFIRARVASRQLLPTFESKRDFTSPCNLFWLCYCNMLYAHHVP